MRFLNCKNRIDRTCVNSLRSRSTNTNLLKRMERGKLTVRLTFRCETIQLYLKITKWKDESFTNPSFSTDSNFCQTTWLRVSKTLINVRTELSESIDQNVVRFIFESNQWGEVSRYTVQWRKVREMLMGLGFTGKAGSNQQLL